MTTRRCFQILIVTFSALIFSIIINFSMLFNHVEECETFFTDGMVLSQKEYDDLNNLLIQYKESITLLQDEIVYLESELDEIKEMNTEDEQNEEVVFNETYLPHEKSNCSINELNKMLDNTALKNCGLYFKNMEDMYNVNSVFCISVAIYESGYMFKTSNSNNYFGFKNNNGWMSFDTSEDSILYFGKLISSKYKELLSLEEIQSRYCPDNNTWANNVKLIMENNYKLIK